MFDPLMFVVTVMFYGLLQTANATAITTSKVMMMLQSVTVTMSKLLLLPLTPGS